MTKNTTNFGFNYWNNSNLLRGLCKECETHTKKTLERNKFEVEIDLVIKCIESQPGDGIAYSYFVFREGYDKYHFMPRHNDFTYPQKLSYWECKDLDTLVPHQMKEGYEPDPQLIELTKKHNCNIFTLKECIRTMNELQGERDD